MTEPQFSPPTNSSKGYATPRTRAAYLWRRFHLGALVAHIFLALVFTWPLALNLLPGAAPATPGTLVVDRDQNLWNLWWVRHALLNGHNPFTTGMIWYPTPVSLYYHTLNPFNGLLAVPLLTFLSLPETYNIIVLFSFAASGYGAYLLVHHVTRNRWAALVGSVVFAYSAYHIATMRGLLQLISIEWVPFYVLLVLRAVSVEVPRGTRGVLRRLLQYVLPASVALLLVTLVDWYYTMYMLMFSALLALYLLFRRGSPLRVRLNRVVQIAACLIVYGILALPVLLPTLRELRSSSYMLPEASASLRYSADLLAFFEPPRFSHTLGAIAANRDSWPFGTNDYEVYFTYTALALSVVGLFSMGREKVEESSGAGRPGRLFWLGSGLLFFVLALGPVLQVNGEQIRWLFAPQLKLMMPYSILERLPIVNISRSPDRFDMPLTLCLSVLAGFGVLVGQRLRPVRRTKRGGAAVALVAVALLVFELAPFPYPQSGARVPAGYEQIAQVRGDFSILELPPQDDFWHGAYRMYFQTAHSKRIFGGYLSREYPHPFLRSTPGYQELTYLDGKGDMFRVGANEWLSALKRYNTRYVILQHKRTPERRDSGLDLQTSRDAITLVLGPDHSTPTYNDNDLEIYRVPEPGHEVPFLRVGEGWQPREDGPNGTFRWMGSEATLYIESPRAVTARLHFRGSGLAPGELRVFRGDQMFFDQTVGALKDYDIGPLGLPQGSSTLRLVSVTGTNSPTALGRGNDRRQLSFALMDVALEEAQK